MIEDILNCQEPSKSILIIDNFENEASCLLFTFINKYLLKENFNVKVYPALSRTADYLIKNQLFHKADIDRLLIDLLFCEDEKCDRIFKTILTECVSSDQNNTVDTEKKTKFKLVIENLNLLIRNFENDPFAVFSFISECRKRQDISTLLMVIHQDSIDDEYLNQIKNCFQTVINVNDVKFTKDELLIKKPNKNLFKYKLSIDHRNYRSGKTINYDETIFVNEDFSVEKVEKHLKNTKAKKEEPVDEEDPLKGLTFNVHLSSDDIQAKKNLILPYELIGNNQKSSTKLEYETNKEVKEDTSKIFYAPDEADDVDDDDPDDDLNF